MFSKVHIRSLNLNTNVLFVGGNQESKCHFNLSHRVTRNMDSNYLPIEGSKTRGLTIRKRVWLEIFFLYREIHTLEIKFWVKKKR